MNLIGGKKKGQALREKHPTNVKSPFWTIKVAFVLIEKLSFLTSQGLSKQQDKTVMSLHPLAWLCGSPLVSGLLRLPHKGVWIIHHTKCHVYILCYPVNKVLVGFSIDDPSQATHRPTRPTLKKSSRSRSTQDKCAGGYPLA